MIRPSGRFILKTSINTIVTEVSLGDIMAKMRLTLGPRETALLFTLEEEGLDVFGLSDARRILGSSDDSVKSVLKRLKKKARIREIGKGKYLLVPARAGLQGSWSEVPYLLVPKLAGEYYVGFWSALNYWGLTEQSPRTVFVVTAKRRKNLKFGPTTFEFIPLSEKKFFGWVEVEMAGGTFRVSDREKTIVDCLDFPKYSGGLDEVVKAMWEGRIELDFEKVLKYAKRQGVGVLLRRLGYILEARGLARDVQKKIRALGFQGFMWLDPAGPKRRLGYSKEYGLILNRTKGEILSWRSA